MSYEISLCKVLESKDNVLYGRLPQIRTIGMSLLSYTSGKFPFYTPHDFSHSLNVEENLNWLIPDPLKDDMNPYEIFFLIVAAWFHDWGMVGVAGESAELIRDQHHIRTENNFDRMHELVKVSEHEGRIIGRICKGHRKVDLMSKEYDDIIFGQNNKIRQRFLGALLRLADECDITSNRTPEVIYHTINPSEQSESEFKKHLSIGGVGQLEEKHKINISAIAKDPKGAKTLREVALKVQHELDGIKGILSQHGITLDVVDLKLETRGFIDKPIGFEINKKKIVDLLVGDHLYANQDVAIRELIQNAIDTCKLKESATPDSNCKVTLKKEPSGVLIVEDNGLGMDYQEAKLFLSNIGTSFYSSEELAERFSKSSYSPISKYGIGILSCFLISDKVIIETYKEGNEACKFSIESVYEEWRYEKGHQKNPGTVITLHLNEDGKVISLDDSLMRYFICPEIPIYFQDIDNELHEFKCDWSAETIVRRFSRRSDVRRTTKPEELLRISKQEYDLIFGSDRDGLCGLTLFNHGIYVGEFPVEGLDYYYFVCINIKSDLVDLNISREDVKINGKWTRFLKLVFADIFDVLENEFAENDEETLIENLSAILEDRFHFRADKIDDLFFHAPFMEPFLDYAYFPIIQNGSVSFVRGKSALKVSLSRRNHIPLNWFDTFI